MIKLMAERRKKVGAGPGGTLTSFGGGMQEITDALRGALGEHVRLEKEVLGLERTPSGYGLHLADGSVAEADAVALAVPAYSAATILGELDPEAAKAAAGVEYPPLSVVALGFSKARLNIDVDAFGFLIPFREGRKVLGTLYDSSIFPERAPEGKVLLRAMVGGARAPELAGLEEDRLMDMVLSELMQITGLRAEPEFTKAYTHEKAIPQYNVGHAGVLEALAGAEKRHPGLYLTGNAFRGVSLNDCVASSIALAERMGSELSKDR
jgi:oxygen-dependent protoporphyrinogen oxidase